MSSSFPFHLNPQLSPSLGAGIVLKGVARAVPTPSLWVCWGWAGGLGQGLATWPVLSSRNGSERPTGAVGGQMVGSPFCWSLYLAGPGSVRTRAPDQWAAGLQVGRKAWFSGAVPRGLEDSPLGEDSFPKASSLYPQAGPAGCPVSRLGAEEEARGGGWPPDSSLPEGGSSTRVLLAYPRPGSEGFSPQEANEPHSQGLCAPCPWKA